jgi:hypothetical protein
LKVLKVWYDVPWTNGKYKITKEGEILNFKTNKNLKLSLSKTGYYNLGLSYDNKKENITLHRLMLKVFKPIENDTCCPFFNVLNPSDAISDQ